MITIGWNAGAPGFYTNSDPDGNASSAKGTLAVDTTTGVIYQNIDGASRWDPHAIPTRWGFKYESDWIGVIGLNNGASGGGTITAPATGTVNNSGSVTMTVSATATPDNCRVRSGWTPLVASGGKIWYESIVKIHNAEDGSDRFTTRIGFGNVSVGDQTNGIYFEADLATFGDTRFRAVCAANGTRTKADTGVSPTAGAFQRYRMKVNAAGTSVDFYIDDVLVATITTNIPNIVGREFDPLFQLTKTLGATARSVTIDYVGLAKVNTTPR